MKRTQPGMILGALSACGVVVLTLAVCTPAATRRGAITPPRPLPTERVAMEHARPQLVRFGSDAELAGFVAEAQAAYREQMRDMRARRQAGALEEGEAAPAAEAPADGDAAGADESITNNQEEGVDEGGIVKVHGDHLVVLRRGRLFTVDIGDGELSPVSVIDAFAPGSSPDAWYDEMLVHGDRIVVIGYSYGAQATEIGLFDIDRGGRLSYRDTFYLRSNDYYSSRNYASRLLGDQLVFYMPYHMFQTRWDDDGPTLHPSFPSVRRHRDGADDWHRVISAEHIYRPVQPSPMPVLHTVVTCDLGQADLGCTAQSILGPYGRTFYVSSNAVYVWVGGGFAATDPDALEPTDEAETQAVVYRLPLRGGEPGALRAWGAPTDQFSFKEGRDGHLNVLVRAEGGGDAMWQPELTDGDVALLRAPLEAFTTAVPIASASMYTGLPRPERGWSFQNRFVGDYVLYGTGSSWGGYDRAAQDPRVFAHPYERAGGTTILSLPHGVDRIEAMGRDAVVVGTDGRDLHFSALRLGSAPRVADRYTQRNASQGETRSHGFFYKPESAHAGTLGLPVRRGGDPGWRQLVEGSASVLYLRVDDLSFRPLGRLSSGRTSTDDRCVASCVDWYGNARPIFLRGRVFALLGYELVEGRVDDGAIAEIARTNFFAQGRRL